MEKTDHNKIVIGLCVHDSIKTATCFNLISMMSTGYFEGIVCTTGTLLPMARSEVVSQIYSFCPDFTHILFIDGDMSGFNQLMVERMVEQDKDIIAPIMTRRVPPFLPAVVFDEKEEIANLNDFLTIFTKKEKPTIKIESIGMAFTLVKKQVFDTIGTKEHGWFFTDRRPRVTLKAEMEREIDKLNTINLDDPIKECFERGVNVGLGARTNTKFIGEDVNFCLEANRHNFSVYCDTSMFINHLGETKYNIGDWLDFASNPKLKSRMEQMTYVFNRG